MSTLVQALRAQADTTCDIIETKDAYEFLRTQSKKLKDLLSDVKCIFNHNSSRQEYQSLNFKDWQKKWADNKDNEAVAVLDLKTFKNELKPKCDELVTLLGKLSKHIKTELGV